MRHRSFTSDFIGSYRAPWWLPGGNAQTIWPAVFARRTRGPVPEYRRERWATPDGDFVDLDFLDTDVSPRRPLVVLFHGLEGSSDSHEESPWLNMRLNDLTRRFIMISRFFIA